MLTEYGIKALWVLGIVAAYIMLLGPWSPLFHKRWRWMLGMARFLWFKGWVAGVGGILLTIRFVPEIADDLDIAWWIFWLAVKNMAGYTVYLLVAHLITGKILRDWSKERQGGARRANLE